MYCLYLGQYEKIAWHNYLKLLEDYHIVNDLNESEKYIPRMNEHVILFIH